MRDTRYEQWMSSLRCEWEYIPTVSLDLVDLAESLGNQARHNKLDTDKVLRYAALMKDGVQFPALIGFHNAEGRWVLITGNHRLHAAREAGLAQFPMYWAKSADEDLYLRELMKRSANIVEGDTLTFAERLSNAVFMVRVYHRELQDVVHNFGVSSGSVRNEIIKMEGEERLARLKQDPRMVSKMSLHAARNIQSDAVYLEVLKAAAQARLPDVQVRELVEVVLKGGGSEADQLARLALARGTTEFEQRERETQGGKIRMRMTIRGFLFRHLDQLDRLVSENPSAEQLQITNPQDVQHLEEAWRRVDFKLKRVIHAVRRSVKAESIGMDTNPEGVGATAQ